MNTPVVDFGPDVDAAARAALLTTLRPLGVPEPATWAMLIAGFGAVGSAARRRRAIAGLA